MKPKEVRREGAGSYKYKKCTYCNNEIEIDRPYTVTFYYCGNCDKIIENAGHSFCGWCGKRIIWN